MRTEVYHEVLCSYLSFCKKRGFHSCYIWACPPPNKRDDYILHCHPEDQRMPSSERLRQWYHSMLERARRYGTVLDVTMQFDEHFPVSSAPSFLSQRALSRRAAETVRLGWRVEGARCKVEGGRRRVSATTWL